MVITGGDGGGGGRDDGGVTSSPVTVSFLISAIGKLKEVAAGSGNILNTCQM